MIRYYFEEKDYNEIHEGNICEYCKARNDECGENPYCCYLGLCEVINGQIMNKQTNKKNRRENKMLFFDYL